MENKDFEVLTQDECAELDDKLKSVEDVTLPESLSTESMEEMLRSIPQKEKSKGIKNGRKKANIKVLKRIVASAAVLAVVIGTVVISPWNRIPPKVTDSDTSAPPVVVEDYSHIENLFAEYSEKHKTYHTYGGNIGTTIFNGLGVDSAIKEESMQDSNVNTNAAPTLKGDSESFLEYAADDYGQTNEQVQGVNEADIIKNDGKYIYLVNPSNAKWNNYLYHSYGAVVDTTQANAEEQTTEAEEKKPFVEYDLSISIVEPDSKGGIQKVYRLDIEKPEEKNIQFAEISEMYVTGDRLIVIANCHIYEKNEEAKTSSTPPSSGVAEDCITYAYSSVSNATMCISYDIADRQSPKELYRVFQKGQYISSRLIGDKLVLLTDYFVDLYCDENQIKSNCIPEIAVDDEDFSRVSVNDICIMDKVYDSSYLVASVMNINNKDSLKTKAVLGGGADVYCTTENLYVTNCVYDAEYAKEVFGTEDSGVKTEIYKFDISDYHIKYIKSCLIDGRALNQFSIDEYNGMLRIATTSGNWGENLVNQLYILDENLETLGLLKNIAKGEEIKSVRFTGEMAYVVTFEVTDPLFVIDLKDPSNPVIKGELKLPGYSAYLHPVGESLLMGVGPDGDEDGTNGGMKVSLFDVSDPQNPVECSKYVITKMSGDFDWSYVDSNAYYDHKALCWDAKNSIMYIPYSQSADKWAGTSYNEFESQGAFAVKVNGKKLELAGDYSRQYTNINYENQVTRVTYIGDTVFTYAHMSALLTSYDKTTAKMLDEIVL